MKLTLDAAAKQVGTSKSTLLRAIRSGALSAERAGDRAFAVEPSELFRWRDARASAAPVDEAGRIPPQAVAQVAASPDLAAEVAAWRTKAEMLERMVTQAEARIEDLSGKLDKAQEIAANVTRQLPPPSAPEPAPVTAPPRRRWPWQR